MDVASMQSLNVNDVFGSRDWDTPRNYLFVMFYLIAWFTQLGVVFAWHLADGFGKKEEDGLTLPLVFEGRQIVSNHKSLLL